ncbi:MAG: chemotaxis protein CheX [Deltaproteobacteria bacterium]|nr:chemotaxis protein CheX [Deltaproteobacteria bacterium]
MLWPSRSRGLYVKKDQVASGDVSGVIGLTGEVNGTISVSFTEKSILAIVSNMLGEEMKELNEDIRDAVGEIANMISGQARQELIAIPFAVDNGEFTIEVCFEE